MNIDEKSLYLLIKDLPKGFTIITNDNYIVRKGDICFVIDPYSDNIWDSVYESIGNTSISRMKTHNGNLRYFATKNPIPKSTQENLDAFEKFLKEHKVPPPEGYEILKEIPDNYKVSRGEYVLIKGDYSWQPVIGWHGNRAKSIGAVYIAIEKPKKPRFPTDKPYPWGY